jgi:hypothetical protein
MFCPKCGSQSDDSARFCRQCGAGIGETVETERLDTASPEPDRSWSSTVTALRARESKFVGWGLVALAAVSIFLRPADGLTVLSAFPGFPMMWIGFTLVFSAASMIRRIGSGLLGAIIVLLPLVALRNATAAQGGVQSLATRTRTALSPPSPASGEPTNVAVNDVPIVKVLFDYQMNEVAADQRYKGHMLRTTGIVSAIKKDILDQPFVLIGLGGTTGIQCSLSKSAAQQASNLFPGKQVTVQGVVTGLMLNVQLTDCTFSTDSPVDSDAGGTRVPLEKSALDAESVKSAAPLSIDPQTQKAFAGEWTGRSHMSSIGVGSITVFLDDNPRIRFAGTNGDFAVDRTLAVVPTALAPQLLLLRVASPQRLPESQPESVDPEPIYWITLQPTPHGDPNSAWLDMGVFLSPDRPAMNLKLDESCRESDKCRVFDFFRQSNP